jgi:DNA-binding transcriptional ArsR family regulator
LLYLRFLNLSLGVCTNLVEVDLLALRLLESIGVAHSNGDALTVTDAMSLSAIASPATMHRKLNDLLEAGLIEQVYEGKNKRTKYLHLTNKANTYFANMGSAMLSAISKA